MENTINPEVEVKKLQDLVRKLEKQNELLRSKADAIGSPTSNGTLPLTEANTNLNSNGDIKSGKIGAKRTNNSDKGLLDAVKVLDTNLGDSDDDTWLYTSPIKPASPEQKCVSPYDWIRQDFEHPTRDQESAKKCLLAKLDEVSRANRNSMGPSVMALQQPQIPNQGNADPLRGIDKLETSPRSQSPPPSQTQRRRTSKEERMGLAKLEDVTDVQILARMQEESLRQAMNSSPANSPRRITVSPASSENALHRSASRSSSVSSTEGKSEDGEEGQRSNVVRRRPSFERIRKAGEGNERKELSPRGPPDGRNGDAKHNAVNRLRGTDEHSKINGLHRRHHDARNGELKAPSKKVIVRRSPSLESPQRRQQKEDRRRYSFSPGAARQALNQMLNAEDDEIQDDEGDESLDIMAELQRPTNFFAEKSPGHRGSLPNLNNRTHVIQPPAPHPTPCTPPQTPMNNESQYQPDMTGVDSGSRMKQPSSIPVNRAPSPRTLKQPSPTKLRGASPHRGSGIPVRASQMDKSQIPRPRSAVIPKSGIPSPNNRTAVSPRSSVKTRDDSWREGCY
ncbi:SLAIN motif-containing protein 2 isoform X2 [Strongylocentrotus purpuratus]|uniref:SLAIN motif-containing protein 2 n=1 Tax=Strongylocentrotus purpuratus TaxID=7668 RepID=A0A7M7NGE6_STRPU|nr:SLAIN motif-containing protein 2 isoform X2 [Strongylocentrotus purpuratus]